jgi:serine/threonine-protein kinase
MIGRIVGNYRIVEKIGEGGMGAVYRAVDLMLERDVALKAIRPELAREPQIVERFRAEARTLARMSHPGIANVYTFFYEEDELFLVMELVRGRTVSRLLQDEGAIPWQKAVLLLASAMEGIEQAHRAGIVHRDLKPDNLILTETGTLKVMDFGIARVMGSGHLTRTGLLVGTLRYMSPEQIRGEEVDGRTDVYALGAVLYEMLTGRTPFEGTSDYAILRAQIEDTPRPPGEQVPSIPWWLDRAVLRALSKHPSERFQSVDEMRRALLRQGETYDSHPPARPIEELPTVITPPGAMRQTPAPLAEMIPPPTLPSMVTPPSAASSPTPPPPPLPGATPALPRTPPPPPAAAFVKPPPPGTAPTPTSYRPVELGRKSGTGRKIAIIAVALFAFVGLLVVGLLVLSSFIPTNQSANGTAESTPAPDGSAPASASTDGQQTEETATGDEPQAAPSTEPASAPRVSSPPLPRPAPRQDTVEEPTGVEPSTQEESQPAASEEPASTYSAPEEPPPAPAAGGPPLQELHRLAAEIELKSAALVDTYGEFLGKKEDSGAELTDKAQKLKDDLDEFQDAAERFNAGFQVGRFARIWGRKPDDRRRIGQNFREMTHLESEIESLMTDVRPSTDVRQAWQEVRSRWRQVTAIVTPLLP